MNCRRLHAKVCRRGIEPLRTLIPIELLLQDRGRPIYLYCMSRFMLIIIKRNIKNIGWGVYRVLPHTYVTTDFPAIAGGVNRAYKLVV